MELLDEAKTSNIFNIRMKFPWSGKDQSKPWTEIVTDAAEILFVKGHLSPIFDEKYPHIKRVENPYLWGRYLLGFEELAANTTSIGERFVIHATSLTNALKIADVNFDWRLVHRARFGQGVSFASTASYAKKYASDKDVYIIAGIPVSNKTCGYYHTTIPPTNYDTTTDRWGNVYVKYCDSDFYPYYIVY